MIRRAREIQIFSLSAIDLFCSALGAFIVITFALLPSFQKTSRQLQNALDDASELAILGIVTQKKSFIAVVDLSGSLIMMPDATGTKLVPGPDYRPAVRRVVEAIVSAPKEGQKLQILGFQGDQQANPILHPWQSPPGMAEIRDTTRAEAMAFMDRLLAGVNGSTPTEEALKLALSHDAEAIFLVTDGQPNNAAYFDQWNQAQKDAYPSQVVETITRLNAGRKEIHCIAIGSFSADPVFTDFLMSLSEKNGGRFLAVSK